MTPVVVSSVPADDAREEVLPLGVGDGHKVRPVVHGDGGSVVQGLEDVAVVGLVVLAFDGENGDLMVLDQGGRDVVLGAERVRGAEPDVRPAELERFHEIGRLLKSHEDRPRSGRPESGLSLAKVLLILSQHGHGPGRPFHPQAALSGQPRVLDVIVHDRLPYSRPSRPCFRPKIAHSRGVFNDGALCYC